MKNKGFACRFLKSTKKMNEMMTKLFLSYVDLKKQPKIDINSENGSQKRYTRSQQCCGLNLGFYNKHDQIKTQRDGTTIQRHCTCLSLDLVLFCCHRHRQHNQDLWFSYNLYMHRSSVEIAVHMKDLGIGNESGFHGGMVRDSTITIDGR